MKISRQPASACGSDETLEELKEVVADYGMDPGKLVMKWKNVDRIVDRIVELSLARAQKGRRLSVRIAPTRRGMVCGSG